MLNNLTTESIYKLIIILAGFIGLCISFLIYHHKKYKKEPLVCPLNFRCDEVVNSEYSKLFGIELEKIGITYYALILITYLIFLLFSHPFLDYINYFNLAISGIAFVVSVYLLYIQTFILKKWCSWCLGSSILSIIIFFFAIKLILMKNII